MISELFLLLARFCSLMRTTTTGRKESEVTEDHQVSASVVARCLLPVYGGAAESPAPWLLGVGFPPLKHLSV